MKITFVVPTLNLSGGLRVISIYATFLSERGHEVTVVSPSNKKNILQKMKDKFTGTKIIKIDFDDTFFNNKKYNVHILEQNRRVVEQDVPDADIIIATFWYTAEWIKNFPENKGSKVYFIQHYENHAWLPIERIAKTFNYPFEKIVVSDWIANALSENHHVKSVKVIGNGVDHNLFYAPMREKNDILTIGYMHDNKGFKGTDIILKAIELIQQQMKEVKIVSFASTKPKATLPLAVNTNFFLSPPQETIKEIYSSCDVWLFGSRSEGFGLPILEAMACRTPVIATRAGIAPEVLSDSKAGYLIDVDNVTAMVEAVLKIAHMKDSDWQNMSNNALIKSKDYNWADKADEFESSLISLLK